MTPEGACPKTLQVVRRRSGPQSDSLKVVVMKKRGKAQLVMLKVDGRSEPQRSASDADNLPMLDVATGTSSTRSFDMIYV